MFLNNLIEPIKRTNNNSNEPSSYSTTSSSLISAMPLTTSEGEDLEPYDSLLSLQSNIHEVQLTSLSLTQTNSNKIGKIIEKKMFYRYFHVFFFRHG